MKILNGILMAMWLVSGWIGITRYDSDRTVSAIAAVVFVVVTAILVVVNRKLLEKE